MSDGSHAIIKVRVPVVVGVVEMGNEWIDGWMDGWMDG